MKKIITLSLLGIIFFTRCEKDDTTEPENQQTTKTEIPFTGVWQRQFEAGPGNLHNVNYLIYQDSIRYTLTGPIGNANYLMKRDTFLLENNRFIGHTSSNQYYLMFTKNVSSDSITIYKQEVDNIDQGLNTNLPSDTTTQNHGWSTYHQ